ncbi:MAG: carbamoyl-phosphate synthase large subunit [bacterium]|nr:carbamoyl-phosphate synthase large subunit [bacterium]
MPRRDDIQTIMLVGSGPIVIGQGCEFDYSGTQACKALKAEGYRIVLLNSNPATIMTDPQFADRTYVEPITADFIEKILRLERTRGQPVDALLPTLGGQTGLNCAMEAAERGILETHGVKLIGASKEAIAKAEDRTLFRQAMLGIGLDLPTSDSARSLAEADAVLAQVGLPCCVRPAYTLGGEGGGLCGTPEEFNRIVARGLERSRIREVLIEESLYGWKEFELEVIRDRKDNFIVVCSIENIDPMGVHTGDSITVAPAQTLTDREFQQMREAAKAIVREIGVDTGGCNVQFAVDPESGRQVVIEMNPRVSRSSALASKATGYPIAKVAAKLAVGYTLDEIPNDITGTTPASFEPVLDYCVVKMPRWAFEKFPDADETLTTQMKSVGEAMAIGRTFKEAWQKCIRSMEVQRAGYGLDKNDAWLAATRHLTARAKKGAPSSSASGRPEMEDRIVVASRLGEAPPDVEESSAGGWPIDEATLRAKLEVPCQGRPHYIRYAFKHGWTVEQVHHLTAIDRWFLDQMHDLVEFENRLQADANAIAGTLANGDTAAQELLHEARTQGYTGEQLARLVGASFDPLAWSDRLGDSGFRSVDTCAAEFEARTPYYYSTCEEPFLQVENGQIQACTDDELQVGPEPHVVIIGGGPNRIGQGIEFDYCCVHACDAARALGLRTVMINSNPETVSTDYDTSDLLFFEPLAAEDVLRVVRAVAARGRLEGVAIQFGGQTPLNLATTLRNADLPVLGTPPDSIDLAEDRHSFQGILDELGLRQPPNSIAHTPAQAERMANDLGYPVLIRPSYVLGGRAMNLCNNDQDLERYVGAAFEATDRIEAPPGGHNVLVDKFILDATEIDVDAVADFRRPDDARGECVVCGVMEHIEEAGIHSGDSACALPPHSLAPEILAEVERQTRALARRIGVCGHINVQFAVAGGTVYVLEVNPRASRTVPFVSKATGVPWARVAMSVMLGRKLRDVLWEMGVGPSPRPIMQAVKAPVFPFNKFPGVDMVLGPEMRSTGEAMGIDTSFGLAFAKSNIAAGLSLPILGNALVSVNDPDKPRVIPIAAALRKLGFKLFATIGTHRALEAAGIESVVVSKQAGAPAGFLLDLINHGVLDLLINTPVHYGPAWEEGRWRAAATARGVPLITTLAGAAAAVEAIRAMRAHGMEEILEVRALQDYAAGVV